MYVAIMGYGVVGSGVASLLKKNHEHIVKKSMQDAMELKYILDRRTFPGDPYEHLVISDFAKIVEDDDVKIVVETMGGLHPAYDFVLASLKAGKSVVTSNKELVAAKGCELLKVAEENNVNFLFEASVGGGIPIIRPIGQCLAANDINEIAGILNGTTNFILTKMISDGMTFDEALLLAQKNGYAERDPSADVEGYDTMRKIAILMSIASGYEVNCDKVMAEGITNIQKEDVKILDKAGYAIRLIGHGKACDGKVFARVSPMVISKNHPLSGVKDVFNAVMIMGDATDEVMFYGKGAGKFPTASAVVADVIDIAKACGNPPKYTWKKPETDIMIDIKDTSSMFYVRAKGVTENEFDVLEVISKTDDEIVLITAEMNEEAFETAKTALEQKGAEFKAVIRKLL